MTAEEYAAAQAVVAAAAAAYAAQFAGMFATAALSTAQWVSLLALMYPQVSRFREQAAEISQTYYEQEREVFHPELPPVERLPEPFEFDWFLEDMEPVRKQLSREKATASDVAVFTLQVVREVQNAGRRQIIHSVQGDDPVKEVVAAFEKQEVLWTPKPRRQIESVKPVIRVPTPQPKPSLVRELKQKISYEFDWKFEPLPEEPKVEYTGPKLVSVQGENRPIQGWARVATGRETCAWCLMLVSRGPVYYNARTAGLKLDDESAKDAVLGGTDVSEFMNEWHIGCDCQVVPVFDKANWAGKDAADRALALWVQADIESDQFVEDNPGRVHKRGKNAGRPYTKNEEIQLALRRKIERGEISPQEWAALSEAA